ncbi:A/G-specific adenine glycosylase [Croceicoccus sediminis]|uniref:A/G-specific adenine glycosylase n=1 Tax=Croceicoccus sediminis TaxID=2571150 RepID=UPI0011823BC3|nr:A/G-specific adenine glycosylase [Croceicoccus sediminis]
MKASDKIDDAAGRLLAWYDGHARTLPWRVPPGSGQAPDPYRVWLSEVMLQQTTVAAVKSYFEKFTQSWPTVEDLASADDADVLSAWAGLGYYARARNLIASAREVAARGGIFPDTEEGLRELPGIGAYTSAAIAAIAFGRRAVVVDANVERVIARLFSITEPLPGSKDAIRAAADTITPDERAGDFAQAMMDLGATICTSRDPRCLLCPLSDMCTARQTGIAADLPRKTPKKARPVRSGTAFWIENDGHVLLVKREGKGMLAGMRALPDDGWSARASGNGEPPLAAEWSRVDGVVGHGFTHFLLELSVHRCEVSDRVAEGEWWPVDRIEEAGLPTLFAKAAKLVLAT